MKIWLAIITTEDTEVYYYGFSKKPTDKKVKEIFFSNEANKENYRKKDWHVCIGCEIQEIEVL